MVHERPELDNPSGRSSNNSDLGSSRLQRLIDAFYAERLCRADIRAHNDGPANFEGRPWSMIGKTAVRRSEDGARCLVYEENDNVRVVFFDASGDETFSHLIKMVPA